MSDQASQYFIIHRLYVKILGSEWTSQTSIFALLYKTDWRSLDYTALNLRRYNSSLGQVLPALLENAL
jgi:hypothetical protein